jgi:molybdopterin molybdotransferase
MISVREAKSCVLSKVQASKIKLVHLDSAFGQVLSESIFAPIDLPNFDNSAMDGYGISFSDLENGVFTFKIVDEIKAGDQYTGELAPETACPIYTGAPIPKGIDVVIPIEKIKESSGSIEIEEYPIVKGQHIRVKGEQIKKGQLALEKGTVLNPSSLGFIAALGLKELTVFKKPKIALITTGNELVDIGEDLIHGQIYNSNSHTLKALVQEVGIFDFVSFHTKDTYETTYNCFKNALENYDMIISTGGVSVGKYDLVAQVLEDLNVEKQFHKVNQKPGKPLYFGLHKKAIVFGLPGNPAAVITSFYQYVSPCIKKMQGHANVTLNNKKATLKHNYLVDSPRTQFLKAKHQNEQVEILNGQGSHLLQTMAMANCLVEIPPHTCAKKGDIVSLQLLPHA